MATLKFIQAQSFSLQASGAASGDTTITLQSFKYSDGTTNIVTADLGDFCYGTLEPNNGTQEEAIRFTGVTQNASGTATLTGVSTVLFKSPYTATSGLAKSHAGGVTFILSNDAAFYGNIISYVNTVGSSGAALADTTTAGISKISVAPASGSNPIAVGDNDTRIPTQTQVNYLSTIVPTAIPYTVAAGTAAAFTASISSGVSSLASGTHFNFLVPITNATGVTLNVNSLGAKSIKKSVSSTLASGDITIGQVVSVVYDGTNFQLTSPISSTFTTRTGTTTHDISVTGTQTIAHGLGAIPKVVRIAATTGTNNQELSYSNGIFDGVNTASIFTVTPLGTATAQNTGVSSTNIIYAENTSGGSGSATIAVDATNITLTWSKSSTPTGTVSLVWEATA